MKTYTPAFPLCGSWSRGRSKPQREGGHRAGKHRAPYLEVILAVYSEPMAEHIPGDHHVRFHAVHSQAVHAQELWQKGIAVTLHYELERKAGKEQVKVPGWTGLLLG